MNYISLNGVIAEALSITPDVDASDWALSRQWAMTALSQLGTSEDEIQTCTIEPKNLILTKPKDMRHFIEISLYDSTGCYIPHTFRAGKKRIYPDARQYPAYIQTSTQYTIPVDVSEDQTSFFLGTNGDGVSSAIVRYFAYPLDENGIPMIRQDEKSAIMYYLRWCKSMKKNENQSEIAQNEQRWKWEFDRIVARKKAMSMSKDKADTIARNWVRLLPSFNYNKF